MVFFVSVFFVSFFVIQRQTVSAAESMQRPLKWRERFSICACANPWVEKKWKHRNLTTHTFSICIGDLGLALSTCGFLLHKGLVVTNCKCPKWRHLHLYKSTWAAVTENRDSANAIHTNCMWCSPRRWLCLVTWTCLHWHSPWWKACKYTA